MTDAICALIANTEKSKSIAAAARLKTEAMDWQIVKCKWANLSNS